MLWEIEHRGKIKDTTRAFVIIYCKDLFRLAGLFVWFINIIVHSRFAKLMYWRSYLLLRSVKNYISISSSTFWISYVAISSSSFSNIAFFFSKCFWLLWWRAPRMCIFHESKPAILVFVFHQVGYIVSEKSKFSCLSRGFVWVSCYL